MKHASTLTLALSVVLGCGGRSAKPETVGTCHTEGLVVVVDRSAGMADAWDAISRELLELFGAPAAAGTSIGLRFFPDAQPVGGCDSFACSSHACATLLVPLAPVTNEPASTDTQEALLDAAVSANTITHDGPVPALALAGALATAATATTAKLSPSVVFVTAGEADACRGDSAQVAAMMLTATGTRTFVAAPATLSDFSELDAVARAGGTGQTLRIGGTDGESLVDVLACQPTR